MTVLARGRPELARGRPRVFPRRLLVAKLSPCSGCESNCAATSAVADPPDADGAKLEVSISLEPTSAMHSLPTLSGAAGEREVCMSMSGALPNVTVALLDGSQIKEPENNKKLTVGL